MKRFGLGKVLLLSALIIGTSGCFGNSNAEIAKVKKEKLPFEKVSSYTYQQLASKLKNAKWTQKIGEEDKDGIKTVTVALTGDYSYQVKGKDMIMQLSMKEFKGMNSDGTYYSINGHVQSRLDYNIAISDGAESLGSMNYGKNFMGESCKAAFIDKTMRKGECIRTIKDTLSGIIKGEV